MLNESALKQLLAAVVQRFRLHDSAIASQLSSILNEIQETEFLAAQEPAPNSIEPPDLRVSGGDILQQHILRCSRCLSWRQPGFGKIPYEVARKMAVVEIVGPDGMIQDERCRFGLFFQDKNTHYPEHKHAAEEIYFVIAGSADWAKNCESPIQREAGQFVLHSENQPHAMQTFSTPMLAMWGWVGDLGAKSYSI